MTEVKKVDFLNLFINSLVNEEQGTELAFMRPKDKEEEIKQEHAEFMSYNIEGNKLAASTGKINKVCDALKVELLKRN